MCSHRAYPRRCGEHCGADLAVGADQGLPPQVRGARRRRFRRRVCDGLTPAGAGSTSYRSPRMCSHRAYPRRCGEHFSAVSTQVVGLGLPPQVRGARVGRQGEEPALGLTPAGAGSTGNPGDESSQRQAYPRRCGEHVWQRPRDRCCPGLPPQVRGALGCQAAHRHPRRLTPAGAGSTRATELPLSSAWAYPRRCGEHRAVAARGV